MEFKDKLKYLRKDQKLTQQKLGMVLGVTQDTISLYEKGIINPPIDILIKISNFFDVSIDALLFNQLKKHKGDRKLLKAEKESNESFYDLYEKAETCSEYSFPKKKNHKQKKTIS